MLRGMLTVTRPQLIALETMAKLAGTTPTLLLQKLSSDGVPESVSLELSQEDAEYLLDMLPPPAQNQQLEHSEVYSLLQNFLQKLRNTAA